MQISRTDMQKLRNVSQDENLESILSEIGIEIESEEKPLLPDITQGKWLPVPLDGTDPDAGYRIEQNDDFSCNTCIAEEVFSKADAKLIAVAPEMAEILLESYRQSFMSERFCTGMDKGRVVDVLRKAGMDI